MFEDLSTRRVFLQRGMTMLAVGATVPAFVNQTVMAIANPADSPLTQLPTGKDGKILVVVQLSGGNDGLNTIVPYADDAYHRARPALRIEPKDVLKLNDYVGLNSNLSPLKKLYDDGLMSVLQGVGYPNPNRSHFRSMDIWHSGQPEKEIVTTGWLGRYFDNTCTGADPHPGVSIGERLPLAMQAEKILPLSFERPESYKYNGADKAEYEKLNTRKVTDEVTTVVETKKPSYGSRKKQPAIEITPASELDFLHRTAMDARVSSDQILKMTNTHQAGGYPGNEFGQGLKTIAAMIRGNLPTRVYYVSLGGFDTHAGQRGRHDNLMKQLADGLGAFWADMKEQGNGERVLMMTFSEFGRRVEQNASMGTDHGAAAPMFLFGPSVKAGVLGRYPSLVDLDQGDLKYNLDFRSVYATVLQEWLETPSKPILGSQFKALPVLKA